jgi:predicted MFS family arabinose efflux permease
VPPHQDLVNALSLLLAQTGPSVRVGQSIGPAVARKLTWRHPETILAVAALARALIALPRLPRSTTSPGSRLKALGSALSIPAGFLKLLLTAISPFSFCTAHVPAMLRSTRELRTDARNSLAIATKMHGA